MYRPNIYDPIPVKIIRGKGCWVWDTSGNKYLDCLAGYSALSHGHCHPKIVKTAIEQMQTLCLTSRAFDPPLLDIWEHKICTTFDSKMVIPMNSGAEAVETAIKCVRKWGNLIKGVEDGQQEIIVFDGNFHGRTTTIISFSSNENFKKGFGPLTPGFISVPYGNATAVFNNINKNTVAVLVEPLQGEGGMNVPPLEFIPLLRKLCNDYNILLILDEVQTGLGRTGYLLAEEYYNIKADITCLGKALGGGIVPISATLDRLGTIMSLLNPGDHGSTWGGNPLACAISMKAIDVLFDEELIFNAKTIGTYLMNEISAMGLYVKGRGLMLGIVPPEGTSRKYCLQLMKEGILVKDSHGIIRITPPLCINLKEANILLKVIKKVFKGGITI